VAYRNFEAQPFSTLHHDGENGDNRTLLELFLTSAQVRNGDEFPLFRKNPGTNSVPATEILPESRRDRDFRKTGNLDLTKNVAKIGFKYYYRNGGTCDLCGGE
jgi:hypothetical protein